MERTLRRTRRAVPDVVPGPGTGPGRSRGGRRGRTVSAGTLLAAIGLVAILIASSAASLGALPGARAGSAPSPTSFSKLVALGAARTAPTPTPPNGCGAFLSDWATLYGGGPAPPAVVGADNGTGCVPGPDEEGVELGSGSGLSGSRFEITVELPKAGTSPAIDLSQFFLSVPVRGVSCSLDGVSLLRIDFAPPGGSLSVAGGWAVRAPVWGLDAPGSCDPRCENTTALYEFEGDSFCLDDVVESGMGAPGFSPVPVFAPGDVLHVTITDGGGHGLIVYANDSSDALLSTVWQYPIGSLVTGGDVEPIDAPAGSVADWAFGDGMGYGWTNCPSFNVSGLPDCDSYRSAIGAAVAVPAVTNASSWDATTLAYVDPYPEMAPWSSSGACSGESELTNCPSIASDNGVIDYPGLSLASSGGRSWIAYGANATDVVGGLPATFAPNGSATDAAPVLYSAASVAANSTEVNVSVRVTDPRGTANVVFLADWCFSSGGTAPTPMTLNGTREPGASNGSEDAFWNASFPRGNPATGGTFYYAFYEVPDAGAAGVPIEGRSTLPSSGLSCGSLNTPAPVPTGAAPRSDGYLVAWAFPASFAPNVRNFSIVATPTAGGSPTIVPIADPLADSGVIGNLSAGTSYTIEVHTTEVSGAAGQSLPTGLAAPATDFPLTATLLPSTFDLLAPALSLTLYGTALGGRAPYTYRFALGNGSIGTISGGTPSESYLAAYGSGLGTLEVDLVVNDSDGNVATAGPFFVNVTGTPGGVPLAISAGDGSVALTWGAPASPGGPVDLYSVYYSQSPTALATLTASWPANSSSSPPVYLVETTLTTLEVPVLNGQAVVAEVIAWNLDGPGLAPVSGPSEGWPAPFVSTGFAPAPGTAYGGPAPFTASLVASTTGGSNDILNDAVFTVERVSPPTPGGFPLVVAPVVANSENATATSGWANVSITLNATGTYLVQAHLTDALDDPELIPSLYLYVGTGAAPQAAIAVSTSIPFAGSPVALVGSASGTPGPYNFTWLFGDGTGAVDAGPYQNHTYAASGSYTVVLTATDNATGGSVTVETELALDARPVVRISASEGVGSTLAWIFQAVEIGGSGPPILAWNFGDGVTANGQGVSHTYAKAGPYTVELRLTDPAGPSAAANLTIYAGVAASGTSSSTATALLAATVALAAALVAAVAFGLIYRGRWRQAEESAVRAEPPRYPEGRPPPPKELPPPGS